MRDKSFIVSFEDETKAFCFTSRELALFLADTKNHNKRFVVYKPGETVIDFSLRPIAEGE